MLCVPPLRGDAVPRGEGRLDGREVEATLALPTRAAFASVGNTVHQRLNAADEMAGHGRVTGGMTDFDHRLQFPVAGCILVILERMRAADRGFALAALRTKAEIHA